MDRLAALLLIALAAVWLTAGAPPSVLVPAYQTGYSSTDDLLRQLLEEVRGLRADLRSSRPGSDNLSVAAVLANRCAACHKADVADQKGGSFVLVEADGTAAELSPAERRRVVREVGKGRMPPPPAALTEAERKLLGGLKP